MTTSPRTEPRSNAATTGIALALLAAASFTGTGFIANELVDDGTPGVVVGFYEASFGLAFVVTINIRRLRAGPTRGATFWILMASGGFAVGFGGYYTALSLIDYSVGAPILGAVPLVSYVAVLFVLRGHERITLRALVGALLIVAGVGLIGATG